MSRKYVISFHLTILFYFETEQKLIIESINDLIYNCIVYFKPS